MSKFRRAMYRDAALLGDVEAAAKGPGPLAKRLARRTVYREDGRVTRRLLRRLGL